MVNRNLLQQEKSRFYGVGNSNEKVKKFFAASNLII